MTSGAKANEEPKLAAGVPCSDCKAIGVPCAVESQATSMRTRPGQTFALGSDGGEAVFIVRSGVLTLQVTLPGGARQLTSIFFPGDMFRSSFAPSHAEAAFIAMSPGEVWRCRLAALEALAAGEPAVRRYLDEAIASRMARQAIHAVTLGKFDCEQKLATVLVEFALRTGARSAGGVMFDLPLSRKDIADYLGLNPDTLSRIISRFKAAGLISHAERSRVVVRDLAALAARSPAAPSLIELSGSRRLETAHHMAL